MRHTWGPRGLGGGHDPRTQNGWGEITHTGVGGDGRWAALGRPLQLSLQPAPTLPLLLPPAWAASPAPALWGVGVARGANGAGMGVLARPPTRTPGQGGREAPLAAPPGELMDTQSTCLWLCWQLNWNRKLAL